MSEQKKTCPMQPRKRGIKKTKCFLCLEEQCAWWTGKECIAICIGKALSSLADVHGSSAAQVSEEKCEHFTEDPLGGPPLCCNGGEDCFYKEAAPDGAKCLRYGGAE